MSEVNFHMKSQITFGLVNGILTPIISFIISFIVGVFILYERFSGNDYFGAVIYYPKIAIVVSIIFPFLTLKKEYVMNVSIKVIVVSSVLSGIIFYLFALLINKVYLLNIANFPALNRSNFGFLVGYDISLDDVAFCGFVLFIVTLSMSLLLRRNL